MRIKFRAEIVKSTDLTDPLGFKSSRKRLLLERLRKKASLLGCTPTSMWLATVNV